MNADVSAARGTLSLQVRQVRLEALGINSYQLMRVDGQDLPQASAGSHIDVYLPGDVVRQYSLCNDPRERDRYSIAVLKDANGRGGSRLLHELLQVSNIVSVSAPRNNFPLSPAARHHLLIGGGIGITPLKAMAHALAAEGKTFELHYCARSPEHAAFREELQAMDGVHLHYDGGDPARGLPLADLLREAPPGTHLYYCGPAGFMSACAAASAHWPAGTVHSEHFKAPERPMSVADDVDSGASDNFIVEIASTGVEIDIPSDRSIVDVLNEAGLNVETSCVSGLCGSCKVKFLSGTVDHRDYILSEEEREDHLTLCVSRATSRKLVLDL